MASNSRNANRRSNNRNTSNNQSNDGFVETVRETAGGYSGSFIRSVRSQPYYAAAIAAGVAGASAFLWTKRGMIVEQAGNVGAKLGDLTDQAGEQAAALRDKITERFAGDDAAGSTGIGSASGQTQSEIAEKAFMLKESGERPEPMIAEQSKVGTVAY